MKRYVILLIIALLQSLAAVANSDIARADSAYSQERYQEALQLYQSQAKHSGTSSDLYYNMGNTYYRMRDLTHAILYYERALQLNPGNSEARENLSFVREKAKISEDTGASFFTDFIMGIVAQQSSNTWATWAVITFILLLGAIALYVFATRVVLRKIGFFGGGLLLIVCALSLLSAFYMRGMARNRKNAIVMTPSAKLSAAPHSPAGKEEAGTLKEGQKIAIQDSVTNNASGQKELWYQVRTADNKVAWILSTDIEKI